ncbi:pyruvate, phosphate dikinase [Chloroflexia bacterium SDU3-3]|nr:pyruvate, phosphate dikinase [Chloroflexia bacterium SDU3-3]
MDDRFIFTLGAGPLSIEQAGGKGASLARLCAAGLPVPEGFVVGTAAYAQFVEKNGIGAAIQAAVARVAAGDLAALEAAERSISALFTQPMPEGIAQPILAAYAALGEHAPVAVRSSATAEDLGDLSFAGQQESFLNIGEAEALLDAIRRCWASLWSARAIGYRAQHHVDQAQLRLAVVVQRMAQADAAGVLFTANPLSGARDELVINAAWGLGESLVSGQVTPDTLVVRRADFTVRERRLAAKQTMVVPDSSGTRQQAVPSDQQGSASISDAQAAQLARLGAQIEQLYGTPMDIEWAIGGGQIAVVQARPITTLHGPAPEVWNDSLAIDALWSNGNVGEAVPDVMTPATWSLVQIFIRDTMAISDVSGYRLIGNIGGRFYMNMSVLATLASTFGMGSDAFHEASGQTFGRIPSGVTTPILPIGRWQIIREILPIAIRMRRRVARSKPLLPGFFARAPQQCEALRQAIAAAQSPQQLGQIWHQRLMPFFHEASRMLESAARSDGGVLVWVRRELGKLASEADTNALLSGLSAGSAELASLGLLVGLGKLARGEIDRASFARQYGHRGPHELEISAPRPGEDPAWVDEQLADMGQTDLGELLRRQEQRQAEAWARLAQAHPRRARRIRRRLAQATEAFRSRELARSEVVRVFWALRDFALRAGELCGVGEDIFYLTIDEILALLGGDQAALDRIPARRAAYLHYRALPAYPAVIRGAFDPDAWAADPSRRSDVYDATQQASQPSAEVRGFPGAQGVVVGRARVLHQAEEGGQLQSGEILVTTITNVGWTPLFPRAAAVVTDVGAPLSHAAIVARELGIPAVVGCGNATMRLHTGDLLRVDGARGTVDVIERAGA